MRSRSRAVATLEASAQSRELQTYERGPLGATPEHHTTPAVTCKRARRLPAPALLRWTRRDQLAPAVGSVLLAHQRKPRHARGLARAGQIPRGGAGLAIRHQQGAGWARTCSVTKRGLPAASAEPGVVTTRQTPAVARAADASAARAGGAEASRALGVSVEKDEQWQPIGPD